MRVLILCTGNSCRSQMAHGLVQALHPEWDVYSAGTQPAAEVNPMAVMVMQEIGVDISMHTPHHVQEYLSESWDCVITVCGGANESCPQFVGHVRQKAAQQNWRYYPTHNIAYFSVFEKSQTI